METARVRSLGRILMVLALLLAPAATFAATEKTLVRLEAGDKVQQARFYVTPGALDFKLTVQNGAIRGEDRVSSTMVSPSGIAILRQKSFNPNVASIDEEVDVRLIDDGNNVLDNGYPKWIRTEPGVTVRSSSPSVTKPRGSAGQDQIKVSNPV